MIGFKRVQRQRFFLLILGVGLFGVLMGCNKPNPNPELLDPVYADIEKEIKETETSLASQEKAVQDFQYALDNVKPQTGQIKYARKRLYDATAALDRSRQRLEYLKIHLKTRLKEDQIHYLKAFNAGQAWPPASEYADYREHERLEQISLKWDVKGRIEATKPTEKKAKAPEGE